MQFEQYASKGIHIESGPNLSVGDFTVVGHNPQPRRELFHGKPLNFVTENTVTIGANVTIGSHCVIEAGVILGDDVYIDHGSIIGSGTVIGSGSMLRYRAQVYRRVRIGDRSIVGGFICNDTVLGDDCDFFGSCVHSYIKAQRGDVEPSPSIGDRVFVGFNALIVGPVHVQDDEIVPAGSVVTSGTYPR